MPLNPTAPPPAALADSPVVIDPADGGRRRLLLGAAAASAAAWLPAGAQAQATWPSRPVRVIVPFPPGGLTDGYARAYSDHLAKKFGQPFVVENKTGAGGTLGVGEVAKAAPDGHTLLVSTSGSVWGSRVLYKKLPFNADRDLVPIALFPSGALILGVPDKLPVKNPKELLDYARANPSNMGTYGAASWPHLIADHWNQTEKTNIVVAHYRGEAPMWVDVVGGQVQMAVGSVQGTCRMSSAAWCARLRPPASCAAPSCPRWPPLPSRVCRIRCSRSTAACRCAHRLAHPATSWRKSPRACARPTPPSASRTCTSSTASPMRR